MGYRSYEIRKLEALFPFGSVGIVNQPSLLRSRRAGDRFGLSYSTFEYSDMETSDVSSEGKFSLNFKITNTSKVTGREVAQVYISDQQCSLPRPVKELKGFVKVELQGGETKTLKIDLNREALGFYDDRQMCWVAEKGKFDVLVGASSADIRLTKQVELATTFTWTGL